jgi:predicted phage tail protein
VEELCAVLGETMRDVYLYGHLAEEFGSHFQFECRNAGHAAMLLEVNFQNRFFDAIKSGSYYVLAGDNIESAESLEAETLLMEMEAETPLHFVPAIAGSGSVKDVLTVVIGTAIVAAAVFFSGGTLAYGVGLFSQAMSMTSAIGLSYGSIAMFGLALTLVGISSMLSGDQGDGGEKKESKLFSSMENTVGQGGCVPLVFGTFEVGSTVISSGMVVTVEDGAAPVSTI